MAHLCPHCENRALDTSATVPYVRGFLLAYQIGSKKFIGCQSCVRKEIFKEVGLSALIGWFSITALVINPFLLVFGVVRGLTVKPDPAAVSRLLQEAGIPDHAGHSDVLLVAYGLAAAMIAADGKIESSEVAAATHYGQALFEGFDPSELMQHMQHAKELPDPSDLATLLRPLLDHEAKVAVYRYLEAIAQADGELAREEAALLASVHAKLGLEAFAAAA